MTGGDDDDDDDDTVGTVGAAPEPLQRVIVCTNSGVSWVFLSLLPFRRNFWSNYQLASLPEVQVQGRVYPFTPFPPGKLHNGP